MNGHISGVSDCLWCMVATATSFHTLFLKLAGNDLWDWMKACKEHMYMLDFPWPCLSRQAVCVCTVHAQL